MAVLTTQSAEYNSIIESIANDAQAGYTDLPYHNWDHALAVTAESRRLTAACLLEGLQIDQFVTDASSLLHDYDFAKPLNPNQIRSKELRSSRAAGAVLRSYGINKIQILHVQSCIRSTEVGVACRSNEARIVRRADLMNVAGEYSGFILNSWRLFQESRQLNGLSIPLSDWLRASRRILTTYVDEDVRLDFEKKENDLCQFTISALKNIWRLGHETEAEFLEKLTD